LAGPSLGLVNILQIIIYIVERRYDKLINSAPGILNKILFTLLSNFRF